LRPQYYDTKPSTGITPPRCGGDDLALTWGVIGPHAMVWGMVQANVGQKFVNSNILQVFKVIGQR